MIESLEIKSIDQLDLYAKYIVEGYLLGLHRSPFHGFSSEFREHKQYNHGDNIKNIDYKVYARTDKMFVKKYDEETNLKCHLIIDVSNSMYFPQDSSLQRKIDYSIIGIASLIHLFKRQRDAFGLTVFDDEIRDQIAPKVTEKNKQTIYATLEKYIRENSRPHTSNIVDTIHKMAYITKKKSLFILFTDLFDSIHQDDFIDEFMKSVQHLLFEKHELIIFHVLDDDLEKNFNYEDKPYQFIDIETGEKIKVQPQEIKTEYKKQYNESFLEIKDKCKAIGVDIVEVDIRKDYKPILTHYLRIRQQWK